MKKQLRKNIIFLLAMLFAIVYISICFLSNKNTVYAALRDSYVIDESFQKEQLQPRLWLLNSGSDEGCIKPYANGNGVLKINVQRTGDMHGTLYFDKYINVEDSEDLVIEYDVDGFDLANKRNPSAINLVKGLGDASNKPSSDITEKADAYLEGISSFFEGDNIYLSTGYAMRSGVSSFDKSTSQPSVHYSKRSESVIDYYKNNIYYDLTDFGYNVHYGFDNVSVDQGSGLDPIGVRAWCGEKFDNFIKNYDIDGTPTLLSTQAEIDEYSVYHIFQSGYTFKHVYKSTGGYQCFVKPIGAEDDEYTLFASLSDYFPNTSEKRFINRSGYVGINVFGEDFSMELDNFKVYTYPSNNQNLVNVQVEENFDLNDGVRYGVGNYTNNFEMTKVAVFSTEGKYAETGFLFNNPSTYAYLYNNSTNKIKCDGLYDVYANIDFEVSVHELTEGKDFGLVIGSKPSDSRFLQHNGNIYIYLRYDSREPDYYCLGVDKVEQMGRSSYGLRKTQIPVTSVDNFGGSYNINVIAKKDGTLEVSIYYEGEKLGESLFFGSQDNQLILKNNVAIYSAENDMFSEGDSSAVVLVKLLRVENIYYSSFNGAKNVEITEDFEGKKNNGEYKNANGIEIYEGSTNTLVSNAGIYVEDGALVMHGVGHKSGIVSKFAYNSFIMYIDIVDIKRDAPVGAAPFVFEFGQKSEGLGGGNTGCSLVVRNPLAVYNDNGDIVRALDESGTDSSISMALANRDALSSIAFNHDGTYEDFGFLRHNLLDKSLDGYAVRFKIEYNPDGVLSIGYYVIGLEDESLLDEPVFSKYYEGGEGYVGFTSTHTLSTSFYCDAIVDNFKVIGTDPYLDSEEIIIEDDFDYSDYLFDFVVSNTNVFANSEGGGCSGSLAGDNLTFVICLISISTVFIVRRKKSKS